MDLHKSRKKVIFSPESQNLLASTPHLNPKTFKELLPLSSKFRFSLDELLLLKSQFDSISTKSSLNLESFRQSLGLFGLPNAPFLSERIFAIIDNNHDGSADFLDYLSYLDTLLNGTDTEKAHQSFRIFDVRGTGQLNSSDIEEMLAQMCLLWHVMTGEKVAPTRQFVQSFVSFFDHDGDGVVSLKDFRNTYKSRDVGLLNWYEFLNNGEKNAEKEPSFLLKTCNKAGKYGLDEDLSQNSQPQSSGNSLKSGLLADMEAQIVEILEIFQEQQRRLEVSEENHHNFAMKHSHCSEELKGPFPELFKQHALSGENNDEEFPEEDLADNTVHMRRSEEFLNNMAGSSDSILGEPGNGNVWELAFLDRAVEKLRELARQAEILKRALGLLANANPLLRATLKEHEIRRDSELKESEDSAGFLSVRHKTQKNIPKTEQVRKSLSIYFGHPNWNLVLNMMIGIRGSVRRKYRWRDCAIDEQDFKMKLELDLIDKRGAEFDKTKASRFYDYCPRVFEAIRKKFAISNESYLKSVGPEQLLGDILLGNLSSLTEFCSSGKSGSLFYYSFDGKFILKTISRLEFVFLQRILKDYYEHLVNNEDSLMIRVFGLHKIKTFRNKNKFNKIYVIVMQNLLDSDLRLDIKYDIKGSFYGRTARSTNTYWDKSIPLKDLDFLEDEMRIFLEKNDKKHFLQVLEKDCEFFVKHNIIDYSLLIAIHFIPQSQQLQSAKLKNNEKNNESFAEKCRTGLLSGDKNKIYIIGVIDILTNYRYYIILVDILYCLKYL